MRNISALFLFLINILCAPAQPRAPAADEIRAVSLVPSVTEIIFALGVDHLLKGNTVQCDYPEAAQHVFKVGDFQSPDWERIVSLRPTLVFATRPVHARLIEKLRESGIGVYVSEPRTVAEVFAEIESIGGMLGVKSRAVRLAESLRQSLEMLPSFPDTPRVYIEIAMAPLMTAGGGSFINDLIRLAGGRNIFEDVSVPYPVIDPEDVVQRNPDVIVVLHPLMERDEIRQRIGWGNVNALRNNRIYVGLDEDIFFRPGPRIVQAVFLLARLLHSVGSS